MMGLYSESQSRTTQRSTRSNSSNSNNTNTRSGGGSSSIAYLQSQIAQTQLNSRHEEETGFRNTDFDASHTRRYVAGDIVSPHDLSFQETRKWRFDPKKRITRDIFDVLGVDPAREYKNFGLLGEFVTDMGRIRPRAENGLSARNQRKVARAVRRSVGMGLMPSVSRHPEVLERELVKRNSNTFYRRR